MFPDWVGLGGVWPNEKLTTPLSKFLVYWPDVDTDIKAEDIIGEMIERANKTGPPKRRGSPADRIGGALSKAAVRVMSELCLTIPHTLSTIGSIPDTVLNALLGPPSSQGCPECARREPQ